MLEEAEALAADPEALRARAESVSGWSVAQHLQHLARAHALCMIAIQRIEAGKCEPKGAPTPSGRLILLTGRIPRGRADAPEPTVPDPDPSDVREELARARAATPSGVKGVRGVVQHPVLGWFSERQWLRFAEVHARHHIAIARDIIAAAAASPGTSARA